LFAPEINKIKAEKKVKKKVAAAEGPYILGISQLSINS
jgi:hypothetical protein